MSAVNEKYRQLDDYEKCVIRQLLSAEFTGRDEIREQLGSALAKQIDSEKSLQFLINPQCGRANVRSRIPVEGSFADSDGIQIHILLHVIDGVAQELEIYKDDGTPIIQMSSRENLSIFTPE
jgi:hypothetical protein